jgi:hypothetical protein
MNAIVCSIRHLILHLTSVSEFIVNRFLLPTFVLLALLLIPAEAQAFDYAAHCRMSNRALRLAVHRATATLPEADPRHTKLRALADSTRGALCVESPEPVRLPSHAYGEWVALVDWAGSPADFYLTPVDARNSSTIDVPADEMVQLGLNPLQGLRVLHDNGSHFGSHALYTFRVWHLHALHEAARGNVEAALIYNAFADHSLEDLFAPGHIFAPRMGLNDMATGGIHNAYNLRGAWYHPREMDSLVVYLDAAEVMRDGLSPSADSLALKAGCVGLDALRACVLGWAGDSIAMFGDNQLERSPRQELFVTLVIARSVEDVFRTWLDGAAAPQPTDHFASLRWCGYASDDWEASIIEWTSPTALIPYGSMRRETDRGLPRMESWRTYRAGYVAGLLERAGYLQISAERLFAAKPAGWSGTATGQGLLADLQDDVSTFWGADARIPLPGEPEDLAVGVFRRGLSSLNRINARVSYVGGVRAQPWREAVEPHLGANLELGFGTLFMEINPSLAWNSHSGLALTVMQGISLAPPKRGKWVPPHPTPPPVTDAGKHACGPESENSVLMP